MWLQPMPMPSDTVVSCWHQAQSSPEQAFVAEYMSALQQQCASLCYELYTNIQQNAGGQVETTVHTRLSITAVSATLASVASHHSASTGVVVLASNEKTPRMLISKNSQQPWNSRA